MSVDPSILFSSSINSMNSYLRNKPMADTVGLAMLFTWWMAGWMENHYLYVLSMVATTVIFIQGLATSIAKKMPIESYSGGAFRRMIFGFWAKGMYENGTPPNGQPTIDLPGFTIDITSISNIILLFFGLFWFIGKYWDQIDLNNLFEINTFYLVLRGITRGSILAAMYYSLWPNVVITDRNVELILLGMYIADPLIAYVQALQVESLDPIMINFGMAKMPAAELRSVAISNSLILVLTIWFGGIAGEMWSLLSTLYILFAVVVFVYAMNAVKDYNQNPLSKSFISSVLGDTANTIETMNLADKVGYVVDQNKNIKMGKDNILNIFKDSVLVPIGEEKGKIKAIIVGKAEAMMKNNEELSSKILDGVSTAILSKKEFNKLKKNIQAQRFDTLDLSKLELPSMEVIENILNQLGFNMSGWLGKLKSELSNMKLSNYGVTELNGVTNVKLPGISVIDGKDMTKVDVIGIKVTDTPDFQHVKIGSWLNVIELPKFTFVTVSGITVLDVKGAGSAVDIFGFKVGDGIDPSRLDEFKAAFLAQVQMYDSMNNQDLGRILVEKDAGALMSVSWDGRFSPLLQGSKDAYGDHPALMAQSAGNDKLLPGMISNPKIDPKFMELTGFGTKKPTKKKKRSIKPKINVDIKIDTSIKSSKSLKSVQSVKSVKQSEKLNEIQDELEEVKKDIEGKKKEEDYIDAEYEIVDQEPEMSKEGLLQCGACGNRQEIGAFCLACGAKLD